MAHETFRTAVLTIHNPTRHVRAVLDRLFRDYTAAYTECLHICEYQYDAPTLLRLATYTPTNKTSQPRLSARTLSKRLFAQESAPIVARTYTAAAAPLESRLRQSLREHVAQTLLGYAQVYQEWFQQAASRNDEIQPADGVMKGSHQKRHQKHHRLSDLSRAPHFPSRLHPHKLYPALRSALDELATLADNLPRERQLVAQLQRTRQGEVVAVPLVGLGPTYGGGIYFNPETNRFYARLDIVGSSSHLGRPITVRGRYIDIKTGVVTVSVGSDYHRADPATATFGRGRRSILVPLEMGRWLEWAQRWSVAPVAPAAPVKPATLVTPEIPEMPVMSDAGMTPVAYLPQRGRDPRQPAAAMPVSAHLVRRADPKRVGGYRYELHVSFKIPVPQGSSRITPEERPLLAINRGIHHLYAAVVTTPDADRMLVYQVASGQKLLAVQQALERHREQRQRSGMAGAHAIDARRVSARNRRQRRIGAQQCAVAANDIVALAQRYDAQVVMEDFSRFSMRHVPYHLQPIMRQRQWQKLAKCIAERLELFGLPPARSVSASYISLDCPRCGARQDARTVAATAAAATADHPRQFVCQRCGASHDRDISAAANIARRLIWIRQRSADKQADLAAEQLVSWEEFAQTHPVSNLYSPAEDATSG